MSHPVWVRGLKLGETQGVGGEVLSHPVWVRGLKRKTLIISILCGRRTPCGCVD